MRISTAATASPPAWQIRSQHQVRCDRPHRNNMCNHPVDWFGRICGISQEIAPFLWCEFCHMTAIATNRREDDNCWHVSGFFNDYRPIYCIKSLIHWCLECCSLLSCTRWTVQQALMVTFHLPIWKSPKIKVSAFPPPFHPFFQSLSQVFSVIPHYFRNSIIYVPLNNLQ